ncbi:MAG: CHC2 zinc finger domain-containing protein [Dehalococcoidia bacterium]
MKPTEIERIKQRTPLEEVMAAHGVNLFPRNGRFVARCPFHEDEHPSLVVYPETRSFHCFGCGAAGDVIDFLRRKEGLGFKEALDRLANGARAQQRPRPVRFRLEDEDRVILQAACNLYHSSLLRHPPALRYLEVRRIPREIAIACRLGFSQGAFLKPLLRANGLSLERAKGLGLLRRNGSEASAGRVTVPELRGGQCIWMVGRAIHTHRLKYLGLSLPKPILGYERVRGQRRVFVTEGAFDYLTGVRWNLPICALLGTHVRARRLRFLEQAEEVVLVFDSDRPGREAAAGLAAVLGERARVVHMPAGIKDLSDLGTRPEGRAIFSELLSDAGVEGGGDDARTG